MNSSRRCDHAAGPLNCQSDVYHREGIDLDVSTLADWVSASAATLMPLDAIRNHVFAAERIHADDTYGAGPGQGQDPDRPALDYVRDDRPFAGPDPPAAVFFYSPDRGGAHPEQHLADTRGCFPRPALLPTLGLSSRDPDVPALPSRGPVRLAVVVSA